MGYFSPQFDASTCGSQAKFYHTGSSPSRTTKNPVSNSGNLESFECMEQSGSATHEGKEGAIFSEHTSNITPEVIGTPCVEGKKSPQNYEHNQQQKILPADVMCTKCKQLLFRPVVLHCGHGIDAFKFSFIYNRLRSSVAENIIIICLFHFSLILYSIL